MELWFTEKQTPTLGLSCKVTETVYAERTQYQDLAILDTAQFGRMLVLDGMVQTTLADEFVYHEMLSHVAMYTHPYPRTVAIIGGGDGGALREVLKHPCVEHAVLIEIDGRVVEACRRYLPETAVAFEDPRAELVLEDGVKYIKDCKSKYDVILVDSTEPVGPAVELFSDSFYRAAFDALTPEGVLVAQTESPFLNQEIIKRSFARVRSAFPLARLFLAPVPTYPSGLWSFTLGSKKEDPLSTAWTLAPGSRAEVACRYYTRRVHAAAFQLPVFVQSLLDEASVMEPSR
ncbi:MAG: polyamine aminopropyltransferase [Firmicutes bacterium]|nr:polyamine aminopropyltransferase [Bacillota bacterium]